ncbi:hypothetical protein [Streptomyces mexicanus]|uniref:hypothetical protein n=1 Tax=Streptomyces mexicanus TaxID=178566 RepID=UPI0036573B78
MPFPSPSRTLGPRRRSLLASAAGAALLAGCSAGSDDSGGTGAASAAARVRERAARDSQELARRYDAVLAVHPALAGRLRPLRAEVARHAAAFGGTAPAASSAPPSPSAPRTAAAGTRGSAGSAGTGASASPAGSPPPGVPGTAKDALAALAAAERSLADRRTAALAQVPGELARLLASVAAAGAAHAYLLTEG